MSKGDGRRRSSFVREEAHCSFRLDYEHEYEHEYEYVYVCTRLLDY